MIHIRKLLFVCNIRAIYGYAQSTFNQHKFCNFLMLKMSSRRTLNLSKNLMQMLVTWWFSITIGRILLHIIAQVVLNYNRVIILMFRLFFNFSSKFQLFAVFSEKKVEWFFACDFHLRFCCNLVESVLVSQSCVSASF